jgi:hypothetical protein
VYAILTFLAAVANGQLQQPVTESPESPWTGRWMPHPPYSEHVDIHDSEHAVRMGVVTTSCDDAKVCLNVNAYYICCKISLSFVEYYKYTCWWPASRGAGRGKK